AGRPVSHRRTQRRGDAPSRHPRSSSVRRRLGAVPPRRPELRRAVDAARARRRRPVARRAVRRGASRGRDDGGGRSRGGARGLPARARRGGTGTLPGSRQMKLSDTQARFQALVTARDSVEAIVARDAQARASVEEMVVGDARLSAVDRLDVYAGMYFVRIHDVLAQELARTAAVLGAEAFHGLVTDYLAACPPSHPSLREAGARLPNFLAGHPLAAERPWLAELARLERARLEVFDGPDAAPVTMAALREV